LKRIAIYPGSFDPPTNGHLDLIERGAKIFDELIVAILRNSEKEPLFSLEERRTMLEQMTRHFSNVRIDTFGGLMVEYAVSQQAEAVLRGIRAISDYEYELQMALMNRKLEPRLETVFMMPAEAYSYLSSRLVKEIAQLGGSVTGLVPPAVEQRLQRKLAEQGRKQSASISTTLQDMDEGALRHNHNEARSRKPAAANSETRRQPVRSGKRK
jgi:pantetheine-phosphate adenylyltransferase